jgi:hypothetical protein
LAISKLWTSLGKDKPEKNDLGAEAAIVHAETGVNTNESYENAAAATDDGLREFQIMAFDTEDEMIPF